MSSNSNYTSGNNDYIAGNNNYAYGNSNYNYAGNSQYNNYNNFQDPKDEEESSFNVMEWVFRILHYWYLFIISLVIAYGIAYLQNRKWLPARHDMPSFAAEFGW